MKLCVLVNHRAAVKDDQTTGLLAAEAARRGHRVHLIGVAELALSQEDRVCAPGTRVRAGGGPLSSELGAEEPVDVSGCDLLLMRTNPGRDARRWAHETALQLARLAQHHGVCVLNDPDGLGRAGSKLYQAWVPAHCRPPTAISARPEVLRAFVEAAPGPCVLKPLMGSRGRDVFRMRQEDRGNLPQILDVLTREGFAMAQHFVPEAVDGDIRLILLDGQLLRVNGLAAAVRRVPGAADFRSNVFVGGRAAPVARITPRMEEVCAAVGERLMADGLVLAGLDLIGSVVVEINVFSPGGLHDAGRYGGVDFGGPVLDALEAHVQAALSDA